LNNLIKANPALQFRYYLLVIILLLIELMPVIAKKILPSGTYDERAMLREKMEKEITQSNIAKEQELKELYNTLAHQNDKEAITNFFGFTKEDRNQKIKAFSNDWKESNNESFDDLWEKMKKNILTRQEQ
jgi:lipopolysaccharide export LptBFGC system permease protein LptF